MAVEISNSGSDIVGAELNVRPLDTCRSPDRLFEEFEVDETLDWIARNSFVRIALQFPEELFHVSSLICLELQKRSESEISFAVLAEKKYGSCCVDEIGAEHFAADCIVHYGKACLSPHPRLAVKYVFIKKCIDMEDLISQLKSTEYMNHEKEFTLIYDLSYHFMRDEIISNLGNSGMRFHCPEIVSPSERDSLPMSGEESEEDDGGVILGRRFLKARDNSQIIYIGNDDSFLTTVMTIFNQSTFLSYSPDTKSLSGNLTKNSKLFMKRYYMMEKAKDSQFVGILVGTLDVTGYSEVIEKIKTAAKAAGKKCRVYSPGTLNPAKLANLPEFDAYVLVACPLNTFMDSSDYYQPIVTPYEMILACSTEFRWSSDYKIAFDGVLSEQIDTDQKETTDISLLTGRIRKIGVDGDEEGRVTNEGEVAVRNNSTSLVKSSDFFQSRTWQGLQPRLGETPVSKFVEGSVGIASGYQHEIVRDIEDL